LSRFSFCCLICAMNFLPWYIGLRYTRSKRRNGFIAFVSLFALFGMALGVFALIVVLSVMNGFDRELKEHILRVVPHGYVGTVEPLEQWQDLAKNISGSEGLMASAPYIDGTALVSFEGGVRGIELQGIAPEYEKNVSLVANYMLLGQLDDLKAGDYGIVLGSIIARNLGVSLGDKVSLTLPIVSVTPAGVFPRSKRFTVVAIFEVNAQVDQSLAMIHVEDAQKLFRMPGRVEGLRLKFEDIYLAPQQIQALRESLGEDYVAKDWSQTQGSIFSAVKMEKTVVSLMLSIIVAIAAFNIVTSLTMMVAEKRSDIAVLRTLGLTPQDVIKVFMVQGTVMGFLGIAFGAFFGIIGAHFLPEIVAFVESTLNFQVFDADVYFVTAIPSQWKLNDTLWTCALAALVSFLATIYPSYRASQIAPAEALRYDI
jgi:lipoprotein-releasing system permease protein